MSGDGLLRNIGQLATCVPADDANGLSDAGLVEQAALAWRDGQIAYAGPEAELPADLAGLESRDAEGGLVVPGLVDCHTHLVFGGWRGDEFALRCAGASYLELARAGGGIQSTVKATRAASESQLLDKAEGVCREMLSLGVTTLEGKSGYGLNFADELKQLRVYRRLAERIAQRIKVTFLGAHTLPPEFKDNRAGYLRELTERIMPAVVDEGLAEFCDVFVENTAFTREEGEQILDTARRLGLGVKIHADQLSDGGGAGLAASRQAVSAEHLEYANQQGIEAMAKAGTVAVSLPLASLYLNEPFLPARRFLDAGVPVAVASDFNPGSAPSFHLPLAMTLACIKQQMSPSESLLGATRHAAKALAMSDSAGCLKPGQPADFVCVDAPSLNHWLYHFRANAARATWCAGIRYPT